MIVLFIDSPTYNTNFTTFPLSTQEKFNENARKSFSGLHFCVQIFRVQKFRQPARVLDNLFLELCFRPKYALLGGQHFAGKTCLCFLSAGIPQPASARYHSARKILWV